MVSNEQLDLSACEREPIHIPGSIQPGGLLLVIDSATDTIIQSAGDFAALLDYPRPLTGVPVRAVLGASIQELVDRAEVVLGHEPACLGSLATSAAGSLTITGHQTGPSTVVELTPSGANSSASRILANIRSITEHISSASDLSEACHRTALEVRRITSYDRVMVYQFLPDWSGSVVGEAKAESLPSFKNHRYPASDIPKQARELYKRNVIRIIPDVHYVPVPLEPQLRSASALPLDMSHCILRSVSPVHLRYLRNMGVGASMSVSLLVRGELWGLIACHNSSARWVAYEAQELCKHVGQILSQAIKTREEADAYRMARELGEYRDTVIRTLIGAKDPRACLLVLGVSLQGIAPAHGMAVHTRNAVTHSGYVPTDPQVTRLAEWLNQRLSGNEVFATDCLSEHYAEAKELTARASGLLATILPGEDPVTLMWFRAEHVEEVKWAGNPHEPVEPGSRLGDINPRSSFATWMETVKGRSRAWEAIAVESVSGFSPRAAFVLQQRQIIELNDQLSQANQQLAALVSQDGLTGIPNRRAFDARLKTEWSRGSRPRRPLAMIMLDIDYFKQFNDRYGHLSGDECLRKVGKALGHGRRAADLPARIGGEEFSILLPDTDIEGALVVAESIRLSIEALTIPHEGSPFGVVTASLGVAAILPNRSGDVLKVVEAADKALYEAKSAGRNRVSRGQYIQDTAGEKGDP